MSLLPVFDHGPRLSNWRCLVINLDRSTERMRDVEKQLARASLPFRRFAAIDGKNIDPDSTPDFSRQKYELRHGKAPTRGEIGCFLSHVGAMRAFLQSDASYCLILEDDSLIDPKIRRTLAGLESLSAQWDVAMLYGNHTGTPQTLAHINERHRLVGFFSRQTGAVAYAINRKAAQTYVDKLLPMTLPIDVDFDRAWDFGFKFRGVLPFPVKTGSHPSEIGEISEKFRWYLRIPTYAARGTNEARRIFHYAVRDPIWLLALRYRLARRIGKFFSPSGFPGTHAEANIPFAEDRPFTATAMHRQG